MTVLFPYGRHGLTPRLGVWAAGMDGWILIDGGTAAGFSLSAGATARCDPLTPYYSPQGQDRTVGLFIEGKRQEHTSPPPFPQSLLLPPPLRRT